MTDLKPLLDLLSGQLGWLPTAVTWLMAIQTALKFINAGIQSRLTEIMAEHAHNSDEEDDILFGELLESRLYRVTAFILDLVFRLKLPTHAEFTRLLKEKTKS